MRKLLLALGLFISLISSAQVAVQNSGSKIRYVNGVYVGTKQDAQFSAADSGAIYTKDDSTLMFKYKGTARALAFANQLDGYKQIGDTLFNTGFTTRARTRQQIDSILAVTVRSVSVNGSTPQQGVASITLPNSSVTNGMLANTSVTINGNLFTLGGSGSLINGTGFVKASGTTISYDNSTYLTGNQTITLSGDISGSGATAITTTIGALKVTNGMLAGSIDYAKMNAATVPTWNQSTTGNAATATLAANSTLWGGNRSGGTYSSGTLQYSLLYNSTSGQWDYATDAQTQTFLGLGSYAYRSSGLAELSGASFTGLLGASAGINSTAAVAYTATGRAASYQDVIRATNTTADMLLSIEGSTGGARYTGSTAYASIVGSASNTPLEFGTNDIIRGRFTGSGGFELLGALTGTSASFSSTLAVSGVTTLYNDVNITGSGKRLNVGNYTWVGGSGGDYGSVGYNVGFTTTTGSYTYAVSDMSSFLKFQTGGFDFWAAASGTAGASMTPSRLMTLTSAGNLTVGATSGTGTGALYAGVGNFNGQVSTATGSGLIVGGSGFAFSPSSTRGSAQIVGSTDRILAFGTNGNQDAYIYSATGLTQIVSTPDFYLVVGGSNRLSVSASTGAAEFVNSISATTAKFNGVGINATPSSGGTSPLNIRFLSTGSDFYVGTESSTAGGFFGGSSAYASVFYSGQPIQSIISGTKRLEVNSSGISVTGVGVFSGAVTGSSLNVTTSSNGLGTINTTNATGGYMTWQTNGVTIADIGTATQVFGSGGSEVFAINGRGARDIAFGTNNTERFRISSSGAATFSSTVTTGLGGVIISSANTKVESDGSSIYLKAAGNTYLNTAASAYVDNGGMLYASATQIPNGGYYKAIRTTGSAVINLLGIEAATDNTVMVASNMFKLRNTGTGDGANLFTVNTSGNGVFTGSVAATAANFSGTLTLSASTPILQFSNGSSAGLIYQAGTTIRLSDNSGGKPIVYDFSDGSMSVNADKSGYAQQISNSNTNGSGVLIQAGNTSSNYPLNVVDKTNTYNYFLVKGNGVISASSLVGTGDRMVVANSSGVLSTQAITASSGTYTPTLTGITNVSAVTAESGYELAYYTRVGNVVTVWGTINVTPTASATNTHVIISGLPISTSSTTYYAGTGSTYNSNNTQSPVQITSTFAGTLLYFTSQGTGIARLTYSFSYIVQ